MKTNIDISIEGDEAREFLRRLLESLKGEVPKQAPPPAQEPETVEEHIPATRDWEACPPVDERFCTFCGIGLVPEHNIPQKRLDNRDHTCSACKNEVVQGRLKSGGNRCCFKCGVDLTARNKARGRLHRCRTCAGRPERTPEQLTLWARERRALVGQTITQPGEFNGALVEEHVRGSLYIIRMPDDDLVNVHHNKQKTLGGDELGAGWRHRY